MDLDQGLNEFHRRLTVALQRKGQPAAHAGLIASRVSDLVRLAVKSQRLLVFNSDPQAASNDQQSRKD